MIIPDYQDAKKPAVFEQVSEMNTFLSMLGKLFFPTLGNRLHPSLKQQCVRNGDFRHINAAQGIQYAFLLALPFALSANYPRHSREKRAGKILSEKGSVLR